MQEIRSKHEYAEAHEPEAYHERNQGQDELKRRHQEGTVDSKDEQLGIMRSELGKPDVIQYNAPHRVQIPNAMVFVQIVVEVRPHIRVALAAAKNSQWNHNAAGKEDPFHNGVRRRIESPGGFLVLTEVFGFGTDDGS